MIAHARLSLYLSSSFVILNIYYDLDTLIIISIYLSYTVDDSKVMKRKKNN